MIDLTTIFSAASTVIVAILAFFIKRTLNEYKAADEKNAQDIEKLRTQLSELKSDLPLVYVLREDFIRVLNNVDTKLDKLLLSSHNTPKKEG